MADKVRVNWRQLKPVEDRGDLLCPPLLEGTAPADHPKAKTDKVLAIQPDDLSSTYSSSPCCRVFFCCPSKPSSSPLPRMTSTPTTECACLRLPVSFPEHYRICALHQRFVLCPIVRDGFWRWTAGLIVCVDSAKALSDGKCHRVCHLHASIRLHRRCPACSICTLSDLHMVHAMLDLCDPARYAVVFRPTTIEIAETKFGATICFGYAPKHHVHCLCCGVSVTDNMLCHRRI